MAARRSVATWPNTNGGIAAEPERDASEDVARELRLRCDLQLCEVPTTLQDFVERHEGSDRRQLTLRLV